MARNLLIPGRRAVQRTSFTPQSNSAGPSQWPGGIFTVGPGQQFATVHEAVTAAEVGQPSKPNPHQHRKLVLVYPGTYTGDYFAPGFPYIDLASVGGDPAETVLERDGLVMVTTGKACWVSGITARCLSSDDTQHPWRDAGPSGDYASGDWQRRTVLVEDCIMRSSDTAGGGGCAIDATPGAGVVLVASRVQFLSPMQPQTINIVGSLQALRPGQTHGWYELLDCHVQSNYGLGNEEGSGTVNYKASPIGLVEGSFKAGDSFVAQDISMDYGSFVPVAEHLSVAPEYQTNAHWYVDPAVIDVKIVGYQPGTPEYADVITGYMLHRTTTGPWPTITDGLSPDAQAYYA